MQSVCAHDCAGVCVRVSCGGKERGMGEIETACACVRVCVEHMRLEAATASLSRKKSKKMNAGVLFLSFCHQERKEKEKSLFSPS